MTEYFDSHTHVQFAAYDKDREDIIRKTLQGGVGFVNVGTNKKTSEEAVELAEKYENDPIFAAIGLHPIHTYETGYHDENESAAGEEVEEFDYDFYKQLALSKKTVAIGECGLDYFRLGVGAEEIKKKQKQAFENQMKLAFEIKKPLMIHCREAFDDLIEMLVRDSDILVPERPGIAHFFSGTKDQAEKLLELGFYFTFGGVVTLTRDYDEVVETVPEDRLLLETDAPYVSPMSHRGKRNEPLYVKEVYERVSGLKGIPIEKLKEIVLENNERVFQMRIN